MVKRVLRRLVHAYVEGGAKGVAVGIGRKLQGGRNGPQPRASGSEDAAERADSSLPPVHPFDAEYGTDTSGLIGWEELSCGGKNDLWNTAYYGISPSGFDQIFAALDLEWERFAFVDLGCGKGRALLLASRLPFRRIVGIEIARALSDAATANVARFSASWQVCREIAVQRGDAAEFRFPAGPLVVYLYHPFLAPVLKQVLKNLEQSLTTEPREVYVVYVNPVLEELTKRVPGFVRLWEQTFPFSEQDLRADRLGAKGDWVTVWRYLPGS